MRWATVVPGESKVVLMEGAMRPKVCVF